MKMPDIEPVRDAITGQDEPMGREHPKLTAMLIFLTYPATIVLGVAVVFILINVFRG
jgi:hypothetical protein